uniref:Kunitz/Bovine pancreatic trypsin inhibitor domain protein n=1 Tax=Steinernema glaseri TaxID=37863 RepID=A0A1I7Y4Z7_9BILA
MWSGCGGNGNRFSSKAECEHLCELEEKVENTNNVCELERDSGPCSDAVTQWYFSKGDGECRKFTYGGCRGNGNRFDTKEQCEKRCIVKSQNLVMFDAKKVCSMPFEKGPCSLLEQQYYFDVNTGRCRTFTYGGCEGNANRFESKEKCYQFW